MDFGFYKKVISFMVEIMLICTFKRLKLSNIQNVHKSKFAKKKNIKLRLKSEMQFILHPYE